eukprot:c28757_g2_i1 orf=173-538(+)
MDQPGMQSTEIAGAQSDIYISMSISISISISMTIQQNSDTIHKYRTHSIPTMDPAQEVLASVNATRKVANDESGRGPIEGGESRYGGGDAEGRCMGIDRGDMREMRKLRGFYEVGDVQRGR